MGNSIHMLNKITPISVVLLIIGFVSCTAGKQATSTALTYTTNVKPIIDANCATTCHNAGRPAGGIDLTTYEKVKEQSLNGKLISAIQHADGAKPMPKKAPKMDDVTIQTIVNWANSGAAL
ncbi:MAG TPA: hypothetical protein PLB46_11145 [Chitinophagales bacterium]|nr:hypothetical protein [Chitinophagales bacterium]